MGALLEQQQILELDLVDDEFGKTHFRVRCDRARQRRVVQIGIDQQGARFLASEQPRKVDRDRRFSFSRQNRRDADDLRLFATERQIGRDLGAAQGFGKLGQRIADGIVADRPYYAIAAPRCLAAR